MRFLRCGLLALPLLLSACDQTPQSEPPVSALAVTPGCDLQQGCRAGNDSMTVDVQFGAAPRALQPFPVSLQVTGSEAPKGISVVFSMRGMDMGLNRYHLIGDATSGWKADITLPVCVSGRSDWVAEFELLTDRRRLRFSVPFVLQKS